MSDDNKPKAVPRFGRRGNGSKPAVSSAETPVAGAGVSRARSASTGGGAKGTAGSAGAAERRSRIHLSATPPARPSANSAGARTEAEKDVSPLQAVSNPSIYGDDEEEILAFPSGPSPLAVVEEWTSDTSTDTTLGLGAEGVRDSERGLNTRTGAVTRKRKRRFTLNERDVAVIRLLGKFRFGYRTQVERYCDRKDLSRRMTQLANAGYLRNEMVTQTQALWTPTQVGLDVAGLDVPALTNGKITPSTIGHTVGLLNLGIDLELGKDDTDPLMDKNWPYRYRREMNPDGTFRLEMGESIITERMIVQSWNRQKALYTESEMKRQLDEALRWKPEGPGIRSFGPETKEGNEWMFVIMSPSKTHTPDMVLARPRNADGSCAHVAIELELTPKSIPEWRRILSSYKGSSIYKTVAYFTHKRTIANSLIAVNQQHVGMKAGEEFVMLKYVPANRNLPFWG